MKKYCPTLLPLEESDSVADETRGTSDDTAIPIDDHVSVGEFEILLGFFYHGFAPVHHTQRFYPTDPSLSVLRKWIPTEEWCKLLVISSKLDCKKVRTRAIDELTARRNKISSIDRIELGNRYDVPQWLPEAYADAFARESHLTTEEGEKLGLKVTVKVLEGRDRCKRNGWKSSGDGNVTQLVKEIFPPSTSPLRNRGFAGKPVYKVSRASANLLWCRPNLLTFRAGLVSSRTQSSNTNDYLGDMVVTMAVVGMIRLKRGRGW